MKHLRLMLAWLSIVILFLCAIFPRGASAEESPVLDTFQQWLSAFNSGDASKIAAFWQKYGSSQLPPARISLDIRLREGTGGMTIVRITEQTEAHLVALMKEHRGIYSESTMDLASQARRSSRASLGTQSRRRRVCLLRHRTMTSLQRRYGSMWLR